MRPSILTDDVLAEIDLQSHVDATDKPPTDEGILRDVYREMWPAQRAAIDKPLGEPELWPRWVNLR